MHAFSRNAIDSIAFFLSKVKFEICANLLFSVYIFTSKVNEIFEMSEEMKTCIGSLFLVRLVKNSLILETFQ